MAHILCVGADSKQISIVELDLKSVRATVAYKAL